MDIIMHGLAGGLVARVGFVPPLGFRNLPQATEILGLQYD